MDFRQIGRAIRTNWVYSLLVFLVCIGVGGASALLPAKQYSANALMLANPNSTADATSAVAAIQFFLPQLALEAQGSAELRQVARVVPARFAHVPVFLAAGAGP